MQVQLKKRLLRFEETADGAVQLYFEDGTLTEVDLLVGADGLRSVSTPTISSVTLEYQLTLGSAQAVRRQAFPSHDLSFSGMVAFRTLVPLDLVSHILPDLPDATIFYHGAESTIFTTEVGGGKFELSLRAKVPEQGQVSWGQTVKKSEFLPYFKVSDPCIVGRRRALMRVPPSQEFHPTLQRLLEAAPEDGWKQFAM